MLKKTRTLRCGRTAVFCIVSLFLSTPAPAQSLANQQVSFAVSAKDGSFDFSVRAGQRILSSSVGAEIDHVWLHSTDYPRHQVSESTFTDDLGSGHSIKVISSGLDDKPDLDYVVEVYDQSHFATVEVYLHNPTRKGFTVQAIRSIEATGDPLLDLGGVWLWIESSPTASAKTGPNCISMTSERRQVECIAVRAASSSTNRQSKQSLLVGALTSDRFLTLLHLAASGIRAGTKITSFTVDSTGTTEVQRDFDLKNAPAEDQIELRVPLAPGADMHSERLMLQAGRDYHAQLRIYGDAIRRLHHARVTAETPIGWWSWTAFYGGINEGVTLANADWQAEHLKSLGYKYFQIDEGYQSARGEYATANATQFPDACDLSEDGLPATG